MAARRERALDPFSALIRNLSAWCPPQPSDRRSPPGRCPGPWPFSASLLWPSSLAIYLPALHGGLLWDDDAHVTKPALRSLHGLVAHLVRGRRHPAVLPAPALRVLGRAPALGRFGRSATTWPTSSSTRRPPGCSSSSCAAFHSRPRGSPPSSSRCTRSAWNRWPGFPSRRTRFQPCSTWDPRSFTSASMQPAGVRSTLGPWRSSSSPS